MWCHWQLCQFLYMMVVNCLPMSEKGVTMGRMFLYVVSVKITSYYRCSLFMFLMIKYGGH